MKVLTVFTVVSQGKIRVPFSFQSQDSAPRIQSRPERSFGIAFDIDGVVLRGHTPIGGSPKALRRLYADSTSSGIDLSTEVKFSNYKNQQIIKDCLIKSGTTIFAIYLITKFKLCTLKVPFLFLTNGGGTPEFRRAIELSDLLGVNILPSQVVQGHSSFKSLLNSFENELIIATGKGQPALVMSEYGFKKVFSIDEYASFFKNIDPVSQYKNWTTKQAFDLTCDPEKLLRRQSVFSGRVKAAFVVSDPVDWGRDIQVLCDILRSGGLPGQENGNQVPLYFAAEDFEYQAAFPFKRLGIGAFKIALESIFNRIHHRPLEYVTYGKPNPVVFKNVEVVLGQILSSHCGDHFLNNVGTDFFRFKRLYMIGDNPIVDIKGAREAGRPWFSILTRTGVFRGEENHAEFPADLVVDTVEEAVDYILETECIS